MHAQVPQFIDIEDRIVGPFTLKQFLYLAGGAVLIGIFYSLFALWIVVLFGIPIAGLSMALAFYQINGRPFVYYLSSFLGFGLKQRIYIWKKPLEEYDIFVAQKTTEKQPMILERITEIAQSSLKKTSWGLNLFGKKEVAPKMEAPPETAKMEDIATADALTINYKEIKAGPNVIGVEETKI